MMNRLNRTSAQKTTAKKDKNCTSFAGNIKVCFATFTKSKQSETFGFEIKT